MNLSCWMYLGVAASGLIGPAHADPLTVVASNAVLADFARTLGGADVTVTMPVPAGTDPALWRPLIPDISAVQAADLVVLNGAGYEAWASRVSLPRARTVDTTRGVEADLIHLPGFSHSHGDAPAHAHSGIAPQVWMDFTLAADQAGVIATALSRDVPAAADDISARLSSLQADLAALDADAQRLGAALDGQAVMVWQPGYEYFGRAGGLALVETTFDAVAPPTGEQLATLDAVMGDMAARIMLWQAAPPAATAAALAARGVTVVVFDSGANPAGDVSFATLMRSNLDQLQAAIETSSN